MHYIISAPSPASRYLRITAHKVCLGGEAVEFQLSSWRPGRYELGQFAKNLRGLRARTQSGQVLEVQKVSRDRWRVNAAPQGTLVIEYEYYAAQPDAGACWLDEELMYVNPVHCLVFDPAAMLKPTTVELRIPPDWQIACALPNADGRILQARDVHELLDSPFFAARSLHHRTYSVNDFQFHIWMQGEVRPDWDRVLADFRGFTEKQLDMMGAFPVPEFHFLILVLPFRFYHGVEHVSSTVLALGPGYQLMDGELYGELMGVASHELFHVWNVKTLRPTDFLVYDYTRENHSELGWVYEGFTTYYGDLFLLRSGFFSPDDLFAEIRLRIQRHTDNPGRFHSSVAESSYDTWLDGYVPGVPGRKTSIYDEGCLIAMMLDLYIRNSSAGKYSIDDLFRTLYAETLGSGYQESDVRRLAAQFSDAGVNRIVDECVRSRNTYEDLLQELLSTVGCRIDYRSSRALNESRYGFRVSYEGGICKVLSVLPGSPASIAGLAKDDEVASCNGWKVENNLSDRIGQQEGNSRLTVFSMRKEKHVELEPLQGRWFDTVRIVKESNASDAQRLRYAEWTGSEW
ncbi:MAG: M61 family metallopeptidase [Bacteroidota bacterium]